jgi:hypothetical protein
MEIADANGGGHEITRNATKEFLYTDEHKGTQMEIADANCRGPRKLIVVMLPGKKMGSKYLPPIFKLSHYPITTFANGKWGIELPEDEECDATKDDSSNAAG